MILDITGFGWSGSGAVHDLLREYEDVCFAAYDYDWEFTLLWTVDGIFDLENKLCYKHSRFVDSNAAIKRFIRLTEALSKEPILHYNTIYRGEFAKLCKAYINDLIQLSFEGNTVHETIYKTKKDSIICSYNKFVKKLLRNRLVSNILKRDLSALFLIKNKQTIYLSYNPDNFIDRTHQFMELLLSYVRMDSSKPLITDQLFPPDNPSLYFKYIKEPSKCIIVRRDPRDTYLLTKETYHNGIPIPVNNVEDFILYYRKTIEDTRLVNNNSILNICFEDLVYNYDETKAKIEEFIGISHHSHPKKHFNPAISVNNTQLYKKYKGHEEDIKKIEEALSSSLYPFDKTKEVPSISGKVF